MSAAAVGTKTPAATAMAGAKTNNNQLKAACRHGHAAAKLLPPSCLPLQNCRCCHCAAAAAAALPPRFPKRCHRLQSHASTKLPPLPPSWPPPPCCHCHRCRRRHRAATTAAPATLPPPPPSCRRLSLRPCSAAAWPLHPRHCRAASASAAMPFFLHRCCRAAMLPASAALLPPPAHCHCQCHAVVNDATASVLIVVVIAVILAVSVTVAATAFS